MILKEDAGPPVQVGKRWNLHLVVDHLYHDEIETLVNEAGMMPPDKRIAQWQSSLSDFIKTLSEEEMSHHKLTVERWNSEGPPKEIQMK